ncbi:Pycsar system effector family protein [Streptomyces sp. NPDC028635]|uniref:Pycsar system effector family protein n=1 Tax=Streptomyces sp. NPDC028635 TaxID=3154800 RepID=UPI0033CA9A3A
MTTPGDDTGPSTNLPADGGAQLTRILLAEVREELVKADSKAAVMLGFLGAALAAVLGAIGSGAIAPRHYPAVPQLLFWTGCAACAPALVLLGLAVTPRLGRPSGSGADSRGAHYFGDARTASVAHLEQMVRRTDPTARDLSQLAALSQIAWTKYRCIRHALAWATASCVLFLLGVATGATT